MFSTALADDIAALRAAADRSADADTRIAVLVACESLTRQLEQLTIELIAGLDADGTFAERGYTRSGYAVADLLGCAIAVATRRVKLAELVAARRTLDGQVLPPRLPATAAVFAAGEVSLRHVELITEALGTPAAGRLTPQEWAGVEEQLAQQATLFRPRELAGLARELINVLDQDGAEPDDRELPPVNELHLTRDRAGTGGRIKGALDASTFDALSTAVMLCRFHHRLLHHPGWTVRIHHGQPEFIPPKWIDTQQIPRRRPPPLQIPRNLLAAQATRGRRRPRGIAV